MNGTFVADLATGVPLFDAKLVNGSIVTNNQLLLSSKHRQCMKITNIVISEIGLTVAVWFKVSSFPTYFPIFAFGNGKPSQGNILMALIQEYVFLSVNNLVVNPMITLINTTANVWYHVAWEMAPTGAWTLYVNGQVGNYETGKIYPPQIARSVNYLGCDGFGVGHFNGSIRDFRVYNRSLSAAEVKLLSATTPV